MSTTADHAAEEVLAEASATLERAERREVLAAGLRLALAARLAKVAADLAHDAGEHRLESLAGLASIGCRGRSRTALSYAVRPRPHGWARG